MLAYSLWVAGTELRAAILVFSGTVIAALWAHRSAKTREIEARHFAEKRQVYSDFLGLLYRSMMAGKAGQKRQSDTQIAKGLIDVKGKMLIWAGAEVIRQWNEFELTISQAPKEPKGMLRAFDKLIKACRKDLGKDDSILRDGELAAFLLQADDKKTIL